MKVTVVRNETTQDGLDALISGGKLVGKIGWTASDLHVDDEGHTQPIAQTAVLNEFGYVNSKGYVVPARPFFRNTIRRESTNWLQDIERGAELVLDNTISFKTVLQTVTATAVKNVQQTVKSRISPPLAPYTLRKRNESRIRLGLRLSTGTLPLLDTGTMIGTLQNEVTNK